MTTSRPDAFRGSLAIEPVEERADGVRVWSGRTDPVWRNMIGPFGGWIAAVLTRAAERAAAGWLAEAGPGAGIVATQTQFMGAIAEGPFTIVTSPARVGRSVSFWQVDLIQDGAIAARGNFTAAARRDTGDFTEPRFAMPAAVAPEDAPRHAHRSLPPWFSAYEMRIVQGPPFTGADTSRSLVWLRHALVEGESAGAVDAAVVAGLADAIYPRVFVLDRGPRPISTVTLSTYIHARPEVLDGLAGQFLLLEAIARRVHDGFFDQQVTLWAPGGTLVATSEQLAWYK
ncbi:thioesterase family protein (plasmid) [Tistrella mobilis]|uniref:thioesterase family protein n=1 Tax=Tistrella mobilis TaxID=171437 RepID=UPI003556841B